MKMNFMYYQILSLKTMQDDNEVNKNLFEKFSNKNELTYNLQQLINNYNLKID